jgi:hypothetical protein
MPVSFNELLEAFLSVDVSGSIGEHSTLSLSET